MMLKLKIIKSAIHAIENPDRDAVPHGGIPRGGRVDGTYQNGLFVPTATLLLFLQRLSVY